MSALTGMSALVRLALRRDRVALPSWVLGITVLVVGTAASFVQLLATPAERASFAAGIGTNPGFRAIYGPAYDLSTVGGASAWRIGSSAGVLTALMSLLLVVRHTRAEEESGRAELVGAGRVGRSAGLAAALLVVVSADLAVAVLVALGLVALGEAVGGAVALGLALASTGLVFAGVAALCAQVAGTARAASGSAGVLLGAAFLVRAAGDLTDSWLSWLSPLGWSIRVRPYAGDRVVVLLLPLLLAVLLAVEAARVAARRDLGAGVLADRPGPAHAAAGLRSTWGLTWRLQRGLLVGWLLSAVAVGARSGALTRDVATVLADSPQLADALARSAGPQRLVDAYRTSIVGLLGTIAAAFACRLCSGCAPRSPPGARRRCWPRRSPAARGRCRPSPRRRWARPSCSSPRARPWA